MEKQHAGSLTGLVGLVKLAKATVNEAAELGFINLVNLGIQLIDAAELAPKLEPAHKDRTNIVGKLTAFLLEAMRAFDLGEDIKPPPGEWVAPPHA